MVSFMNHIDVIIVSDASSVFSRFLAEKMNFGESFISDLLYIDRENYSIFQYIDYDWRNFLERS